MVEILRKLMSIMLMNLETVHQLGITYQNLEGCVILIFLLVLLRANFVGTSSLSGVHLGRAALGMEYLRYGLKPKVS
jgi:hypothetical protein